MKTISLISMLILMAGCIKSGNDGTKCAGNCFILTGTVADTPSNAGLKSVELRFYHRTSGFTLFDPTVYLGKTTTDANGDYKFQFDGTNYKKGTGYFLLEPKKSSFFYASSTNDEVERFYLDSSNFNIPFNQKITLYRQAKMAVSIRPTSGIHYEYLTFLYQHGNNASGVVLNKNQIVDTTIFFQTAGDINTFVQWDASGTGVRVTRKDTVFTTQGGTIQYRIDL